MAHVIVTGGSGKVGRACIADLIAHGYEVASVDTVSPRAEICPFTMVDLSDFGQAMEAFSEIDDRFRGVNSVVHLAAIPAPGKNPNAVIFRDNMFSTYNVFESARRLGIKNVVWASSETVLGLPFTTPPRTCRSMRNMRDDQRQPTLFPSSWAKKWRNSFADGIPS